MSIYEGRLEAYWEQGWEGMIVFCFLPDDSANPNDLITLENGQHLSIFDNDGSTLWQGKIHLVRRGMLDRHKLNSGIWSDSKQKGVSYANWMDWFWRNPALRARLILDE